MFSLTRPTAEVVAVGVEEQAGEQGFGGFARRRFAGAHHAIDVGQSVVAVLGLVGLERVADPGTGGDMVDVEQLDIVDPGGVERGQIFRRHFVTGLDVDAAGRFVDDVIGAVAAEDFLGRDQQVGQAVLLRLVGGARADLGAGREDTSPLLASTRSKVGLVPRQASAV
jgi:hypothetical protein